MSTFLYKTRHGDDPRGKPRVYFTSHADDFEEHFENICADIFGSQNCAIYYTKDMNEPLSEEDLDGELLRMNLVVVPVSAKLLLTENRAMSVDIAYAKEKNLPILPIAVESGLDEYYSRPDKFGEMQYLTRESADLTEISYAEKLAKYLESVLISDETARLIRAAFDSYIFLSYRKKDRKYANELMRLIHENPEYRDIAIWYDEFLTPGESFNENIERMLADSKLFALLVTPSILEELDGHPNFVMGREYPMAKKCELEVLPIEMEDTDRASLSEKFDGIAECLNTRDSDFKQRLAASLTRCAVSESEKDARHNFLIGLAYLEGIDVEVERERALHLITSAAEAGLIEAIKRLYDMYTQGAGVKLDFATAAEWGEKLYAAYVKEYGEKSPETVKTLNELSCAYHRLGNYERSLELCSELLALYGEIYGENNAESLDVINNAAQCYVSLGEYGTAIELQETAYRRAVELYGEEDPRTLIKCSNLSASYIRFGAYDRARELLDKAYSIVAATHGEESREAADVLSSIALCYTKCGYCNEALNIRLRVYSLYYNTCGEVHPETLAALGNLARAYSDIGDNETALRYSGYVYDLSCKFLGERHPDTLTALNNLAIDYRRSSIFDKALEASKAAYSLAVELLGREHPHALMSLNNLAIAYDCADDHETSLRLKEEAYAIWCKTLGEEYPDTIISLGNIAYSHFLIGDCKKALETEEKVYELYKKVLGDRHDDTLSSLYNIAYYSYHGGDTENALLIAKRAYEQRASSFGENHPSTLEILDFIKEISHAD